MPWTRRDRDAGRFAGTIEFVAAEARIWDPECMGLFTLAGYARSCGRDLSTEKIRRYRFRQRSGTACFREVCFSRTAENVVAQANCGKRGTNVRLRFDDFRGFAVQCSWRFGCGAREVRARFPIVVVGLQDNLIPGSARVSRVGFGVSPKRTLVLLSGERGLLARSCRQPAGNSYTCPGIG